MKHWKYEEHTYNNNKGIVLIKEERVICIGIDNDEVFFEENCDGYFGIDGMTKEDAIDVLQEAIDWIKEI